jgi:hypothetical protein
VAGACTPVPTMPTSRSNTTFTNAWQTGQESGVVPATPS